MAYCLWIKKGNRYVKVATSPIESKEKAERIARTTFSGFECKITKVNENS